MKKKYLKVILVFLITIIVPNALSYIIFDYTFIRATVIAAFFIAGVILFSSKNK
jgi:hypothetical protein